ncbi:MAG: 16S rRNA (cytidine(1402)-2'-O)-methyltransferase [Tepidibacillus sp.]
MNIQKSYKVEPQKGCLYLVGTPIGNLQDMTYRAIQILSEVDLIAAEDTRQTIKLLNHFQIQKKLYSYHEHNKESSGAELLQLLEKGRNIALVSDAGMPAISDPGYELVRSSVERGIPVIPIPGANAALTGLIASGLPTQRFVFLGFLSKEKKVLSQQLEQIKSYQETLIIYEAPHRIEKTLKMILEGLGDRNLVLIRELTKKHEEFIRGTVFEVMQYVEEHPPKGELTLIIQGSSGKEIERETNQWWQSLSILEHVEHYIKQDKQPKEAIKLTAKDRNLNKREVYQQYHKL